MPAGANRRAIFRKKQGRSKLRPFEHRNVLTLVFVPPPTLLAGVMYGIAVIIVI